MMWLWTARSNQFLALRDGERPEWRSPLGQRVAAPHVVDQHVQSLLFGAHPGEELRYFLLHGVVRSDGDAAAALRGDHFRGLLYRFRASGRGGPSPHAAARAVHGCACRAQHAGNAAAGAARGPGDDGHPVTEGHVRTWCSAPALTVEQPVDVCQVMPAVPGVGADRDRQCGRTRLGVHELALQLVPAQGPAAG